MLRRWCDRIWYERHSIGLLLVPLGWLYRIGAGLRRLAYRFGYLPVEKLSVPVVVVGNISVGGTGKTPLVIHLTKMLSSEGHRPGIVLRGYGGKATQWPQRVTPNSDPNQVGDEAVLLAQATGCAVAAGPDRVAAARSLIASGCNLIVSDDGLQHLRLSRDIEIAVLDGERRNGNGRCLPAGPLREGQGRLRSVDIVVTNGEAEGEEMAMHYQLGQPRSLRDPATEKPWHEFVASIVHAVAAIGHPARFFADLAAKGLIVQAHAFPDHHLFKERDIEFDDPYPVLMTEKDAVKCGSIGGARHWVVPLTAELPLAFDQRVLALLGEKLRGQEAA
jgi:tetraacyldisaccharide 4'-kinase